MILLSTKNFLRFRSIDLFFFFLGGKNNFLSVRESLRDDLLKIRFLFFFLFNYFEWYALHVIYHRMFGEKGGFVNEDDNLKGNDLKEKILRERLFFRSRLKKEIGQFSKSNPSRPPHVSVYI